MTLEIRSPGGRGELNAAFALRRAVFCDEQGVSLAEEFDGRDDEAQHLVAVEEGRVVATCRLLHEGATTKLGRLAVAVDARRRGIASGLLTHADAIARARGAERIVLHAQTAARALYDADGYQPRGDVFVEAGIEHITMEKAIGRA